MSETHGVPESTARTNQEAPRAKTETERRAFEKAKPEAIRPTNLEARQGAASAETAYDLPEIWRDAFGPMMQAQIEASRWFDQMWRQATGLPAFAAMRPARMFSAGMAPALGAPAADLKETDAAYELSVELPGVTRDDIELKILRDTVRICGQKSETHEESRADYRVSERRFGRFERSFPIPPDVRRDAIAAAFEHGVLTVVLPKAESAEASARKIEIK